MRIHSAISMLQRALPLLLGVACSAVSTLSAAAPGCPGAAAWCDDLEQGAAHWRLEDGKPAQLRTDAGKRLLVVQPGPATLLASTDAAGMPATAGRYLEARVRAAAGHAEAGSPHRGILAVRYLDAGNWLGAAINLVPGSPRMTVDLVQMRDGRLTRLRSLGHDAAPAGSFQTLRVELAGAELAAWLDGERIAATLPASFPAAAAAAGTALLARDGAVEFDGLRLGAAGAQPGRVALARNLARVRLQAGDVRRYPVSAYAGDAVTPLDIGATSSDPSVAAVAIDGRDLVVTARRAGKATIRIASTLDANVGSALAASVGPAFAARGAALPRRLSPAAGAVDVPIDTLLRIRFDSVPLPGADASIRIHRVRDHALVDTIRLGDELDTIGYAGQAFKRAVRFEPVRVEGKEAVIRLHSARLDYDTDYLVTVDAAAFTAVAGGQAFMGVSEAAGWRFHTRARPPAGNTLSVDDDGPADFRTVQGALNHAMATLPRAEPVTIHVANGRYEELLYLRGKDKVTLRGESRDGVVIAARNDDGTNPGSGSGQAATSPAATGGRSVFLVEDADLLTLERFTLVNTARRANSLGSQAEALHFNSERRLVARDASFLSEQDTIQVKGYAWFYRTLVAGNVDFIWGANHAALFEESEIRSVGDSAHPDGGGYVVQARTVDASDPGFVFLNSRLTHGPGPAGNDVPPGSSWLARPGTATAWDKVVYVNCRIGGHIAPGGWSLPAALPAGARTGSGWMEAGSMDPDGRPLDLSARRGGRVLTPEQAAPYASRARVFAHFDDGKGWDPAPVQDK